MNRATPLVPQAEQAWSQPPLAKVWRRLRWAVRGVFGRRQVTREVQGVTLAMPWSHRLPDFAGGDSIYGQNLVRLAELLSQPGAPLLVLDIGANIGDSALQILDATDARVLCVEADAFYLRFLETNTAADRRVVVENALLLPDGAEPGAMVPVRHGGSTRFARSQSTSPQSATVTVTELRARHPEFEALRLVKSDTDGYEVQLVPAVAAAYAAVRPVLFFEFDIVLTREAGLDPFAVWASSRPSATPRSRSGTTAVGRSPGCRSARWSGPRRSSRPRPPTARRRSGDAGGRLPTGTSRPSTVWTRWGWPPSRRWSRSARPPTGPAWPAPRRIPWPGS